MDEATREVAWVMAEAWWRNGHRSAGAPAASVISSERFADYFWQGWISEAERALRALGWCAESSPDAMIHPGLSAAAASASAIVARI
jgi:hypothetical protein